MHILAIETSCDETAIALVEASPITHPYGRYGARGGLKNPHFKILKNLVASQIKIHQPYGGVVPNLAKREHLKNLPILFKKICPFGTSPVGRQNTGYRIQDIDLIVVTVGPGLEPCLWVGINFAKELYKSIKSHISGIKLLGVNHLEGHLYSNLLNSQSSILFPAVGLIVSGGHTTLLLMNDLIHYKKLGETRDDAIGESFDKVARLLKLSYPGGPEIEKLAKRGSPNAVNFPRPMINQRNYDFSFSGLKTAVLYYLRDNKNVKIEDVASGFQAAAFEVLINKTLRAAKEYKAKSILVSGGVASNISLRKYLKLRIKNEKLRVNFFVPPKKFCGDNAAMIAAAGYINYLQHKNHRLLAQGNLNLK